MAYKRNTDPKFWQEERRDCNCGSFALNLCSWFTPYDNDEIYTDEARIALIEEMYEEGLSIADIYDVLMEYDQAEILKQCPWLEPISLKEAAPTDRVVSYRLYIDEESLEYGEPDEDYHFRVRINGFWFEKCGEDPIRFCGIEADEEPWKTTPYLVYDSDVLYFRFKK